MESGEVRSRFGRCPYCRAMIYQDPDAVIYYCTKCRTPIRGKNPEPTEDMDHALSRLEILSADSASVFSDDLDACHKHASVPDAVHGDQPPLFGNAILAAKSRDDARVCSNGQGERRRPSSRRTRRSACSDSLVLRYGVFMSTQSETEDGFSSPRNARGRQRRRSLAGLEEVEASAGWPRPAPPRVALAPSSPLTDPAFQRDLLRSLDSLRGLIAASIEPAVAARRGPRFFRRLESHLAQALPPAHDDAARRNAGGSTAGSSRSSSSSASSTAGARSERRRRHHHCRPVLGGAPFLVCGSCTELLQVPATVTLLSRRKVARLRCGGCDEVLELTAPASGVAGSATQQTTPMSSPVLPESDDPGSRHGSERGSGAQPLHRALGYSSPSPLLQSRRY